VTDLIREKAGFRINLPFAAIVRCFLLSHAKLQAFELILVLAYSQNKFAFGFPLSKKKSKRAVYLVTQSIGVPPQADQEGESLSPETWSLTPSVSDNMLSDKCL